MAERILQESEEIGPGDRLTVFFDAFVGVAWFGSSTDSDAIKGEISRVFSGTIFPVDTVEVPSALGAALPVKNSFAFSGLAGGQSGLYTTLPNRNITTAEFRDFVDSRLALISGLWGETVTKIVAGDQTAQAAPVLTKNLLYIAVGIAAVIALGYLLAGLGSVGRVVKPA